MQPKSSNELYELFEQLGIRYEVYHHPPAPTIDIAREFWKDIPSAHCRNIFFRNHKGNRHYLVIVEHNSEFDIHSLEKRLRQGKLTFASTQRLFKYLGVKPGAVTPYGLINDAEHHVHVFIDEAFKNAEKISFHPLVNTASVVTLFSDFIRFLQTIGNSYEFINLRPNSDTL